MVANAKHLSAPYKGPSRKLVGGWGALNKKADHYNTQGLNEVSSWEAIFISYLSHSYNGVIIV